MEVQVQQDALKAQLRHDLDEARERTWRLMAPLSEEVLTDAVCEYLSPPVWDLGHIANFEERWLVQELRACAEMHDGYNQTYNAFENPRHVRPKLDLLDRRGVRAYMDDVRRATLDVLEDLDLGCSKLTNDGFVHRMLVMHEDQHQETLLQSIQMRGAAGHDVLPATIRRLPEPRAVRDEAGFVAVPGGSSIMGRDHAPGSYDNEAPAHMVEVSAYEMGRFPVTMGDHLRFMEEGGYEDRSHWSDRGRAWLDETGTGAPLYWEQEDGAWWRRGPGCRIRVTEWPDIILSHVSFFEAEAHASWAGARLPTEAEWEKAARWSPDGTRKMPWGDAPADVARANIDQTAFAPSRIGAFPDGAAACGAEHLIGDVWEWTSSGFLPYDGFAAFPYDEYSQVFFGGDYKVLRGGSWATRARCATATFRNWDHPYRRQVFAGFRLARDTTD